MAGAPPGNQNAKVGREWREALRRAMAHKADGDYRNTLLKIAGAVVDKALDGEAVAWQEIANREDGKPAQPIGGADDLPPIGLTHIERTIVDPNDPHA